MKWHVAKYADPYSLNLCSAFNPSRCTHTHTHTLWTHTGAVGSHIAAVAGEQLGVWCLAQGFHLSLGIEGGREHWLFTSKSKWLDNWDCLGFGGIQKRALSFTFFFIIVGWLCPHTAKTHLYSNEDNCHLMYPLKLKYYNLNSSDEWFWKSDSNQCWALL